VALTEDDEVFVDDHGLLHRGTAWIALSPVQEGIVRLLLDRFGQPVTRAEIAAAVWSGRASARTLDVAMARLRPKVAGLGFVVHTIRGRGYLLALGA
jgi:DNA-binding response OmpR family regulator